MDLGRLEFDLPPALSFRADGWTSSIEYVSGFYSNVRLGPSCKPFGNGSSCGMPLDVLPPGAILVSWGNIARFGVSAQPERVAPNTSIAGLPSTITTDKPGICRGLHTDETITVRIEDLGGNDDFEMQVCLTLPNLPAGEQLVTAMLASVSIGNA